jgi:hypothetical protein
MQHWETILGISSIILLLLPVTLLLINFKEGRMSFLALIIYFSQIIIINLISAGVVKVPPGVNRTLGIINNLLDAPLMLIGLRYFTLQPKLRKLLQHLAAGFIIFELVVILFKGFNTKILTIIIGPDLLIVTAFCGYFFFQHVKSSFSRRKDMGKAFMSGALVFAYACFNFMYIVHYVLRNPNFTDILKIYHLTHIITAITISIGLLIIMRDKKRKPIIEPKIKQEEINAFQYL